MPTRPGTGSAATRVAAAGGAGAAASANCFSPNEEQIAYLLARGEYNATVTAQWDAADEVSLVPINLCPDARAQLDAALDANANIDAMQAAVAANAEITAELSPSYSTDNVLAVDQSGDELTVYVY
jgi:hypothetical protein